ncbi:MAG: T9SS type A sorting domain-containing protein [Ignavibacteriae bacterium]|nr:T9SS type A sorting domain-containing protein [Ignavibacteriota bacterium]
MKTKLLLIIIFFINNIFSQQDSIDELIKYYPLHIGDYWEYEVSQRDEGKIYSWIGFRKIIGDTLLNNRNYFTVTESKMGTVNSDFIRRYFLRIDSLKGNIYEYDQSIKDILVDSLQINIGDTLKYNCSKLSDFYIKEIFGNSVETRIYTEACITNELVSYDIELSKNFGLTNKLYSESIVTPISYEYNLIFANINGIEYGIKTDINNNFPLQKSFLLKQNYPNPFNPTTNINYSVPKSQNVKIIIYDMLGNEVKTILNELKIAGNYSINFNGENLSSGIYFYRLIAGENILTKKMTYIK